MSDTDILAAVRTKDPARYDQVMGEMVPIFGQPRTWEAAVARGAFLRITRGDPPWAKDHPDAHWTTTPTCGDENCVTPEHAEWDPPDEDS